MGDHVDSSGYTVHPFMPFEPYLKPTEGGERASQIDIHPCTACPATTCEPDPPPTPIQYMPPVSLVRSFNVSTGINGAKGDESDFNEGEDVTDTRRSERRSCTRTSPSCHPEITIWSDEPHANETLRESGRQIAYTAGERTASVPSSSSAIGDRESVPLWNG